MTGAAGKLQIRAAQNRPAPFPRAKLGAGGFPRGRHMKRDNRAVHSARPRIFISSACAAGNETNTNP